MMFMCGLAVRGFGCIGAPFVRGVTRRGPGSAVAARRELRHARVRHAADTPVGGFVWRKTPFVLDASAESGVPKVAVCRGEGASIDNFPLVSRGSRKICPMVAWKVSAPAALVVSDEAGAACRRSRLLFQGAKTRQIAVVLRHVSRVRIRRAGGRCGGV